MELRNGEALSLASKDATGGQRALVATACGLAVIAAALLLPFVSLPLQPLPNLAGIYATGILVADICTYLLLHAQFRVSGERWLLPLASAYLFSALMAALHLLTFPGALIPSTSIIGGPKTVSWLYVLWGLGFVGLLVAAVIASASAERARERSRAALRAAIGTALAVAVLLAALLLADPALPPFAVGDQFSPWGMAINYLRGVLALAGLAIIWSSPRHERLLPLWLSLILVTAAVGPLLTDLAGQRYTLGWYAGRASFLFASYVLLAVLLNEFVKLQHAMVASVVRTSRQADELQQEVGRRELAERRLVASERNHAIGQLVGGVAHDFNNLLTAVIANLEIILRLTTQDGVRRSAENAQHAAFRGARLTQSLLAFSRRQPLRNESVVANELVARCHVLLQRAAGENIRVELHPSIAPWTCRADPAQLETALLNLIANSRDAMPSGGRIVITTRNSVHRADSTTDGRAELSPGDYVEIAVADTGNGIAPELRDRVFEPFFTTKDSFGGAGLGLSQVQGFTRQLGGDVLIDSTLGEGTRVRMLLPRAHEERPIGELVRAF